MFSCNPQIIAFPLDLNLSELEDVTLTGPTNNQVLTFNSTTLQWENQASQGGGGGGSRTYTGVSPIIINNDTNEIFWVPQITTDYNGLFDGNKSTFYIDFNNSTNRLFSLLTLDNNSNFDARYAQIGEVVTGIFEGSNIDVNSNTGDVLVSFDPDGNLLFPDANAVIFRDGQLGVYSNTDGQLNIFADSALVIETNDTTFGDGSASNLPLTFDTSTNDGTYRWNRASDFFQFSDDILMNDGEGIFFGTGGDVSHVFLTPTTYQTDFDVLGNGVTWDIGATGVLELQIAPNLITFNNGTIDTNIDWATSGTMLLNAIDVNALNNFAVGSGRIFVGSSNYGIEPDLNLNAISAGCADAEFLGGDGTCQTGGGDPTTDTTLDTNTGANTSWLATQQTITANRIFSDDTSAIFGGSDDAQFLWNSTGTNDFFALGLDVSSAEFTGTFRIIEDADIGKQFDVPIQSNPTVAIHSSDENLFFSMQHNQQSPFFDAVGIQTWDFNAVGKGIRAIGGFLEADFNGPQSFIRKGLVINDNGDSDMNAIFRVEGSGDVNLLVSDPVNDRIGIGTGTPSELLDLDGGTGRGIIEVDGDTGGCLKIQDTDDAGFTYCTALNGVLSCSTSAC